MYKNRYNQLIIVWMRESQNNHRSVGLWNSKRRSAVKGHGCRTTSRLCGPPGRPHSPLEAARSDTWEWESVLIRLWFRWGRIQDVERRPDVPDRPVGEPARVTLVHAVVEGGVQLFRGGDGGVDGLARLYCLVKCHWTIFFVVVENHTWGESRRSGGQLQPTENRSDRDERNSRSFQQILEKL